MLKTISLLSTECKLGALLLGTTSEGVSFLSLGDSKEVCLEEFEQEFPIIKLREHEEREQAWLSQIVRSLEDGENPSHIPLDLNGTELQLAVWRALREIPAGEVRTYSQIAAAISRRSAVRAVATACGTNKVAFLVPCHRVIRADGGMGGYRWGLRRKQLLLAQERKV